MVLKQIVLVGMLYKRVGVGQCINIVLKLSAVKLFPSSVKNKGLDLLSNVPSTLMIQPNLISP